MLLAVPPRHRADREALDRRDPARADGRAASFLRDSRPGPRHIRPTPLGAPQGARGGVDRRTPGDRRRPRAGRVLADGEGPRARAGRALAEVVGARVAGLTVRAL